MAVGREVLALGSPGELTRTLGISLQHPAAACVTPLLLFVRRAVRHLALSEPESAAGMAVGREVLALGSPGELLRTLSGAYGGRHSKTRAAKSARARQ